MYSLYKIYPGIIGKNRREMAFIFEHGVQVVHVQHTYHEDACIDVTVVQNILLYFIVVLLYLSYDFVYILYLD